MVPALLVVVLADDAGMDGFESRVIVDGVLGPFNIVAEADVTVGDVNGGNANKV